ncbi:MAG: hypothetical protein K0Q73_1815 [Paenibacillus sp.]|nr:hypothetical protein [Paenibacillus sp.]
MYAIISRDKQKRAEIAGTSKGIQLTLRSDGEQSPNFTGQLDEMLICSFGRPWRSDFVRLEDVQIISESDLIRICGKMEALTFTMELAFDEHHLLKINATWENRTDRTLHDVATGFLFVLPRWSKEIITIPHMIYNNNPSADPSRVVPRLGLGPDKGFICEEHRLPIPCVNVEWSEAAEARFISLFSVPAYMESADGVMHYGSLGAIQEEDRIMLAAMSGVLMFNGEKDMYYMGKNKTGPYNSGYVDITPGFSLTKQYALDWGVVAHPGQGFREIVRKGMELFAPVGAKPLTLEEMIRLKKNALDDRWRTGENGAAGYVKFSDSNEFGNVSKRPLHYMYGWTGQCLKLAWCDAKLGFTHGQEERISHCEQAVDFYLRKSRTNVPGIRHSSYRLVEGQWDGFNWNKQVVISSRALGETIADLAEIILLFRDMGREVPAYWVEALSESTDFFLAGALPSGIYPAAWLLDGSSAEDRITAAGLPCLIAVVKSYRVTGEKRYLDAAETMMQRYYELHVKTFERPFACSTLDANCEDKEAGMYFFLAAYELYVLTENERYSEWAEISGDWLLTYVYMWNPVFDRGSQFRNAGFTATGWPGVSVQNHHLDVFFPTFEFWHFGRLTGKTQYERLGRMVFDALGQGICTNPGEWNFTVVGEQGEGFFQTHWHHRGHSNKWNPSWVTALVLHNALRFLDAAE